MLPAPLCSSAISSPKLAKETVYGLRGNHFDSAFVWSDHAQGRVVGQTAPDFSRAECLHCLLDLGGASGPPLQLRPLPVSFLFAGNLWRLPASLVRTQTRSVAELASVLARTLDSLGSGAFPAHLLLLSRRLL